MVNFTYRNGIAVLQLAAFSPCLALSLLLCFRQGMKAVASCWRFLIILACLRIAGAICELIMITNTSDSVITAKLICDLLGIAPLTLAAVGLLQRVNESIDKVPVNAFRLITLASLAGLGLGIYGAMKAIDEGVISPILQAALAMFVACLGLMICILLFVTSFLALMPRSEKIIVFSVYICTPFLIVRMVYAAIGDFGHDARFSIFDGDPTIFLCMSVLMEIILMAICLIVGFKCPPPSQQTKFGE